MAVQAQIPLCGSQDWMMDNGCGGVGFINNYNFDYYSNLQQQKQQQQQQIQLQSQQYQQLLQNHQQKNQNFCFENSSVLPSCSLKNSNQMSFSQSMAAYDEKQRQEIDHYIRLQNERLRLLLQAQRKQQIASLVKIIESKALPLFKQKDEEIAKAAKRTTELEDFLKKLQMESQSWQRVAQENEAMVISLNNEIEQLREKASWSFDNGAEDAESCCEMNREEEEETQQINRVFHDNVKEEEETARKKMMICKGCNSRNSCILFLPCRHLCSCRACEAFLDFCPVCQTPKKATIEALIS